MHASTVITTARRAALGLLTLLLVVTPAPLGADEAPAPASAPGPSRVIVGGWYDLFVVDVDAGKVLSTINIDETANDIAVTADGRLALAATDAGLVHADLKAGKRVGLDDWGMLCSVELSADDTRLAALTCPGHTPFKNEHHTIRLEDLPGKRHLAELQFSTNAHDIFLSPDDSLLFASNKIGRNIGWTSTEATGKEAGLKVLSLGDGGSDLQRMTRVATLVPLGGPGGRRQLVGLETPGEDKPMILWLATFPRHGTAGEPRVVRLGTSRPGNTQGAAAGPDGRTLFVNCKTHLLVYDLVQRKEAAWVELPNEHRWLALDPAGERVFLTCTPDEGEGYLTEVSRGDGGQWKVTGRIVMPASVNVISTMPEMN